MALEMEPSSDPPAMHTGEPLAIAPPPTLEVRDDATEASIAAARAAEAAASNSPISRFNSFKVRATGPVSLIKAEFISDDGAVDGGRASTWLVHAVVAGASISTPTISVVQVTTDGEIPGCIGIRGYAGRVDAMLVEQVGSSFRLIQNSRGAVSFMANSEDGQYRWHLGPAISEAELTLAVGVL